MEQKHCKSAKLPWHHNIKLSHLILSQCSVLKYYFWKAILGAFRNFQNPGHDHKSVHNQWLRTDLWSCHWSWAWLITMPMTHFALIRSCTENKSPQKNQGSVEPFAMFGMHRSGSSGSLGWRLSSPGSLAFLAMGSALSSSAEGFITSSTFVSLTNSSTY